MGQPGFRSAFGRNWRQRFGQGYGRGSAEGAAPKSAQGAATLGTITATMTGLVSNYPTSAAEMAAAVGRGTWDAAWLCDESSGNLAPVFGSGTLVPTGSPTYSITGPKGGADKAVRLTDNTTQCFSANVFSLNATNDIVLCWVGKHPAAPGATRIFLSKRAAATAYYSLQMSSGASGTISWVLTDATNSIVATCISATHIADTWYVGMACFERGSVNQGRVATNLNTGAAVSPTPGSLGDCSNTAGFGPGRGGSTTAAVDIAYLAVGVGSGYASGMVANIAAAITSFKAYLGI